MIYRCPAPLKGGDEDMKAVLNVAGLDRETENTNSRKEKIMINNSK